jgi:hypothetical protein
MNKMKKLHRIIPSWSRSDEHKQTLTTLELFDEGMKYCDTKSWKIRFLTECMGRMIDELGVDTRTVLRILDLENTFNEVEDE